MAPPSAAPATLAKGAGVGIGLALIANLVVFAIGNTGAPLQVVMNGESEPSDLAVGAVIGASIAPVIIGALRAARPGPRRKGDGFQTLCSAGSRRRTSKR